MNEWLNQKEMRALDNFIDYFAENELSTLEAFNVLNVLAFQMMKSYVRNSPEERYAKEKMLKMLAFLKAES